ncbi:c-type cytochrome [Candidatus Nitrosacidococcus tergens]|uniref:Cytochrome c class I n=1 Tax=Candidatus Nitrosacidococcus tergens TaxID=553981 RepID=A0A7G1QBA7_9GAMM|nr:c-type cytochrome [Candidatus Nitrosacidococcus tergens]CAB1276878.1 Cytochrome c class I [Candidatus Nitrosacidococcus tergens]
MLRYFVATAAFIFFTASSHAVLVNGNAKVGKDKSVACQSCHGEDGNSESPEFPNLAGQNARYIQKQLEDFKSKARENPIMSPMAEALSDEDIADLAVYFSSQKLKQGQTPDKYLDLGQKVFRRGMKEDNVPACMACHGAFGEGNPAAAFPRISGQNVEYVKAQLKSYRKLERSNDPNQMMEDVTHKITDEEIAAVAHYVNGLSEER